MVRILVPFFLYTLSLASMNDSPKNAPNKHESELSIILFDEVATNEFQAKLLGILLSGKYAFASISDFASIFSDADYNRTVTAQEYP